MPWLDYPFLVERKDSSQSLNMINVIAALVYDPKPLRADYYVSFVMPDINSVILPFLPIKPCLAWSCTCRLCREVSTQHLRREFILLKKNAHVLSNVLQDRYFREALNLVIVGAGAPGDFSVEVEVFDLDIVLMEPGRLDEDDCIEALSATEEERYDDLAPIDFESKKSTASLFKDLGYSVKMGPGEDKNLEYPMAVSNRSTTNKYSYIAKSWLSD